MVVTAITVGEVVTAGTELGAVEEGFPDETLVIMVVSTPPGNRHTLTCY